MQALINLAAAGFKARWGNVRGVRANAKTASDLFESAARQLGSRGGRYMGLDVRVLERRASEVAGRPSAFDVIGGRPGAVVFDFVLRPE